MSTFFTIFGASGDLAKLKIYPALFTLAYRHKLPEDFFIVGFARSQFSDAEFFDIFANSVREHIHVWGPQEEEILMELKRHIRYISAPYDIASSYQTYQEMVYSMNKGTQSPTQVLYLAVPPGIVSPILRYFSLAFAQRQDRDIRVILEKPFGHDGPSAHLLLGELREYYDDRELYFLDHYMGKKSMRSLLALRAKNRIIDTILTPSQIERIEISALENFDVRDRVGYFDSVGIIRDMIQSHLFQMLALITLDLPTTLEPIAIAHARESLITKIRFDSSRHGISTGQYATYKSDNEVTKNSETETYIALSLSLDDPRWSHIPIYMRSGKSLLKKETYIVVTFRPSDHAGPQDEPNRLIISLYPNEELSLRFLDESGDRRETHEIVTRDSIAGDPAVYLGSHELLFLDAIEHERRFFLTPPEILASWTCIDAIFAHIDETRLVPEIYQNQSAGPEGQYKVLSKWQTIDNK